MFPPYWLSWAALPCLGPPLDWSNLGIVFLVQWLKKRQRVDLLGVPAWWTLLESPFFFFFFNFFLMFIYLWETEWEWGRGREREGDRIWSRLQTLSCQHRARHGTQTHELWDHDLSQSRMLNQLSHPGAPGVSFQFLPLCRRYQPCLLLGEC